MSNSTSITYCLKKLLTFTNKIFRDFQNPTESLPQICSTASWLLKAACLQIFRASFTKQYVSRIL